MSTSPENIVGSGHSNDGYNGYQPPTSVAGGGAASPSALRHAIERTREDMSHTIDAIEARLSPIHLLDQVTGGLTSAGQKRMQRAQAWGTQARLQASDIAYAARDQATYQMEQGRVWLDNTRRQYPWLPAAAAGTAAALAALGLAVVWLRARGDGIAGYSQRRGTSSTLRSRK
jgi:hypothetical protein